MAGLSTKWNASSAVTLHISPFRTDGATYGTPHRFPFRLPTSTSHLDTAKRTLVDYAYLGRTGLKVSRLALGTMNFGMQTDAVGSEAVLDAAFDAGVNFVDTADAYGGPQSPTMPQGFGVSEEAIGNWLRRDPTRRDQIVLATKLYQPMGLGPNDRHLSAYHIRRACEASLRRLQTDHIDLYQMHHVDRGTPWEEIWQAMDQLVTAGKVTYIGSSNFAGWHVATAQSVATGLGHLGLVSEQSRYNLTSRAIEAELIPALRHFGVGLIPYGPIGGGLLAGVLDQPQEGRRASLQKQVEQHRRQLEAYEQLCRELGEPPADVAVAWVLASQVVSAAIVGPRTADQLQASLRAVDITLEADVLARLDEIWPGPGGEAPESYAW